MICCRSTGSKRRELIHELWPNKSPEPTAVGAVSSAVAVHVASRRWLSFLRQAKHHEEKNMKKWTVGELQAMRLGWRYMLVLGSLAIIVPV